MAYLVDTWTLWWRSINSFELKTSGEMLSEFVIIHEQQTTLLGLYRMSGIVWLTARLHDRDQE